MENCQITIKINNHQTSETASLSMLFDNDASKIIYRLLCMMLVRIHAYKQKAVAK